MQSAGIESVVEMSQQ